METLPGDGQCVQLIMRIDAAYHEARVARRLQTLVLEAKTCQQTTVYQTLQGHKLTREHPAIPAQHKQPFSGSGGSRRCTGQGLLPSGQRMGGALGRSVPKGGAVGTELAKHRATLSPSARSTRSGV